MLLKHTQEIAFGEYGGAELFFADIDGDGQIEIIAYQGPAVFGAANLGKPDYIRTSLPRTTCLSASRRDGSRIWTWGKPGSPDKPYICHAHESCVAVGDLDGDGVMEIAVADGRFIHLLDGPTGAGKGRVQMPFDNFYIVQALGEPVEEHEAALVVKNGETGYEGWEYGQPVIGLNANLDVAWGPVRIAGGGHHVLSLDLDGDGRREFLVGYCAVKPSGEIAWHVDAVDTEELDAAHEHVDYTDVHTFDSLIMAFAGTNKAYLVLPGGETLFAQPGRHVQGCALGRFREDSAYQVAVYNDDGPMVLYDPSGEQLWELPTEERWPLGMPKCCEGRVFHRNRPIVRFSAGNDWIVFTDGGWPWGMDGDGKISLEFEPPENSVQPEVSLPPKARGDDLGYGFATKVLDWDGDGQEEALIYDRRYLWVFKSGR